MQGIPQGQNSQNGQNTQGGSQKPSLSWQSPANTPNKPAMQMPAERPKMAMPPAAKIESGTNREKSNTSKYIGIFIAGLVVGILLGWGIANGRSGTNSTATTTAQVTVIPAETPITDTSAPTQGTSMGANTVEVASSQNAGLTVAVSKVQVTKPTWMVVYDNNAGVPGRALGATLFLPTDKIQTGGTIGLLRATVSGTTYLVGQLVDDGDYALSFQKDMPVLDASGKPSLMTLTAN